jgi:cyclic beta-1,2-glucan synthetase
VELVGQPTAPATAQRRAVAADRDYLATVARDTWRLFERCVVAGEHDLPPDNLQTAPHDMVAHRTSPTNIGLYLLATVCAREFGWIGRNETIARLEATLAALQELPRHRGHFSTGTTPSARRRCCRSTSRQSTAATCACI